MIRSQPKSITQRKGIANDARKALAAFVSIATLQQDAEKAEDGQRADLFHDQATKRLLWAEAHVQRLLYLQTAGRLGRQSPTLRTVLSEYEASRQG